MGWIGVGSYDAVGLVGLCIAKPLDMFIHAGTFLFLCHLVYIPLVSSRMKGLLYMMVVSREVVSPLDHGFR